MKRLSTVLLICAALSSIPHTITAGFLEEEVKVANHPASITLVGTLTIPDNGSPQAALVLATGSGAQNRDEEIMGHKPFKVIAETLSARGYAVLRMDDRGTGESGGDFSSATTDDLATDIAAGVTEMAHRYPKIPVGVLGHSEGGTIAIKEAISNPLCDLIITLGAPAWSGDSIIMSQGRALAVGLTGKWDVESHQREILALVKSNLSDLQLRIALSAKINGMYGERASLPQIKEVIDKQLDVLASPWYRQMVRYDPSNDISNVRKPWFALNGERDTQVLPENLQTIKKLNPAVDTLLLQAHNHLFQKCTTGLINEYEKISDDISDETLEAISRWLDNFNRE